MNPQKSWEAAAEKVRSALPDFEPELALVLGSGMGFLGEEVEGAVAIPFGEIPGFPVSTVAGHKGRLVLGKLAGKKVILMQGRFHAYEGHSQQVLALPTRMFHALGVKGLVLTNAAGAVNPDFRAGDFMLIRDHLNFSFSNPLIGGNDEGLGPRFPDTSRTWSENWRGHFRSVSESAGIPLREGVYQFNLGPSYETPAEVQMARGLGADVVGMSTVPEAIAAAHCGLPCLGISYVSNLGAGLSQEPLTHEEVIQNMERDKGRFGQLIRLLLQTFSTEHL